MLNMLRRYDLSVIKIKFIIIYALNALDIIFTVFLLQSGLFAEGNILMSPVVESRLLSFVLKIILPLVLLIVLFLRMKQANERQLKTGNMIINCCLLFYSLINLSHVFWMILYKTYLL